MTESVPERDALVHFWDSPLSVGRCFGFPVGKFRVGKFRLLGKFRGGSSDAEAELDLEDEWDEHQAGEVLCEKPYGQELAAVP